MQATVLFEAPASHLKAGVTERGVMLETEASPPFVPRAVERPGGGRIRVKHDPAPTDVVRVKGVAGAIPLQRLAALALKALQRDARQAGIAGPLLLPVSGYRSSARQKELFDAAVARYGSPEVARKWVAPPGHSAHQSGRAIDFYLGGRNSSGNIAALRRMRAYIWLRDNAVTYGFYPYGAEPWHWEYNPPA